MFQPAKGATSFYAANDKLYRGDEGGPGSGGGGSGTGGDAIWAALSAFGLEGSANIIEYAAKKQQEAMTGAENNQDQAPVANGEEPQSDQKAGGGVSSSDLWTLSFTGEAQDETKDGKTRQMGVGKLSILDADGNIIESFDAISGPDNNGLLPNGDYKVSNLITKNAGFADEKGLDYKLYVDPIGNLAKGFKRALLRIHPTPSINYGLYVRTTQTEGCIGLVGNKNAAPFLEYMQTYFKTHTVIYLNVDIINNANIKFPLYNKLHY